MNIVLLGHQDIASVQALDMLMRLRPGHSYRVFWSAPKPASQKDAPTLASLGYTERALFDQYLTTDASAPLREAQVLDAPNSAAGLEMLASQHPALIVSIRYRRILREDAIAIPTHGVLNLHSGILPDYRGVMATFWAMLAGEHEIGATLHRIVDSGIDTGPVISVGRQPLDYSVSYLENVLRLYPEGCAAIAEAIDDLGKSGAVTLQAQPADTGQYFGPPTEADALRFLARGLRLLPGG